MVPTPQRLNSIPQSPDNPSPTRSAKSRRPTFAPMTFSDLNLDKSLSQALADLGYTTPTTIQQKVFSVVMSGKDVCGIAQTGTGKTFAYLLPLLRQLEYSKEPYPRILIIVPTRELVVQVVSAIEQLSTHKTVRAVGIFGGVNMSPQMKQVEEGADVIVATPGRLLDALLCGSLKPKAIKKLVIDEVDEMLNLGFRPQLRRVIDLLPPRRQNLMFSATITDDVEALIQTYFNAPVTIEAAPTGTPLEGIEQAAYYVPNFNTKVALLKWLLARHSAEMTKVLVFVSSRRLADQLFEPMAEFLPEAVGVIHSNKEQNYRFRSVSDFSSGAIRVLIATDIIARGIDVSGVSHVINFDLPEVAEHYIHRIGRTGRAGEKGQAISFITDKDKAALEGIEALMNYHVPVKELPEEVDISTELTADELPKANTKEIQIKRPKIDEGGGAFHEKSLKRQKVNVKVSFKEKMMDKYGKPKKRKPKK